MGHKKANNIMEKYNSKENIQQSAPMSETASMDLTQMREQLAILKQKLDKQTIVTDQLIHQAMKHKMSWITKYCWAAALILFPCLCVGWWEAKDVFGMSLCSYLLLMVFTGCCIVADLFVNRMRQEDWANENLIRTSEKLARMKHVRKTQSIIQMSLLVIVLLVIAYDIYTAGVLPAEEMTIVGISSLTGLIVGGTIGLKVLARMQRTNDEIIKQIGELTDSQAQ